MKRKTWILALLAVVLVVSAAIGPTMAYFTTYTRAKGGYTIHNGTEFDESFADWTKSLSIVNTGTQAVFVRARAYSGQTYPATTQTSGGWFDGGDGWWYYGSAMNALTPLKGGETASGLSVLVQHIPVGKDSTYVPEEGENFNVVVLYESAPIQYDKDGAPLYDWARATVREGGQS